MLVSLHVVQDEHLLVAFRKLIDGPVEIQVVQHAAEPQVRCAELHRNLGLFLGLEHGIERFLHVPLLANSHEHHIHRQPMEPSGEARLSAEGVNLAEHLHEGFLGEVFGFGRIAGHAQAQTIYAPAV